MLSRLGTSRVPPPLYETDDVEERYLDQPEPEVEHEAPQLTKTELKQQARLRRELFIHGSTFKPTSRSEIVGIDNILEDIDETIHWLRHHEQYEEYGARLQPGAVFSGSPGTGKTLVSRYVATASGALFINVRDFPHSGAMFTDTDIRELYDHARATQKKTGRPIVLFWDEFETIAQERSDSNSTPEQRSVTSQLTTELDGVHGKNDGLLLIGCTNYSHSIDEALMRRGRMGVHIEFHAPDRAGKEKILAYYLGQMTTMAGIDMHTLSYFFTRQSTAADIEEACVEAWRHAVRRSIESGAVPILSQEDLVEVFIKQLVGPKPFNLPEDEKLPIAIHECGHAIVALTFGVPVRLITVQPGKKTLGKVMIDDLAEYTATVPESINHMKVGMGGLVAERTAGFPPMTAATRDIKMVNEIGDYLITQLYAGNRTGYFNFTALGRTSGYSVLQPQVSEPYMRNADDDLRDLLSLVEEEAVEALVRVGKENLFAIAETVNRRTTMTGHELRDLFIEVCGFPPELT